MILILDNYDSFTFNLVHLVEKITGETVSVFRNDKMAIAEIEKFDKIILSPGPGIPSEAGILLDVIKTYAPSKSILGICLGHQAIAEAFGGSLTNLTKVFHGVSTPVTVTHSTALFDDLPASFEAGRYHSWIVNEKDLPGSLEVTSRDAEGNIMSLQHKNFNVQGLQFHPESILTPLGETILRNWLKH